jgi:hypothetical protein
MGQQYFLGLQAVLGGSGDPKYPGGQLFNLFNLGGAAGSPASFEMRTKEVKNGRLAMVAWLGFMVQACVTHKGPVQNVLVRNLTQHRYGWCCMPYSMAYTVWYLGHARGS